MTSVCLFAFCHTFPYHKMMTHFKKKKKKKEECHFLQMQKNLEHEGDDYTNRDWCIRYSN